MTLRNILCAMGTYAGTLAAVAVAMAQDTPAPLVEQVKVRAVAHFDFDRGSLKENDQAQILDEIGKLKDVSWKNVIAVGHTDSVGQSAYNESLSERRAAAVRTYQVGKGLDPRMIRTEGKGAGDPVANNESTTGRAKNRRVDIEFLGVRAMSQQ